MGGSAQLCASLQQVSAGSSSLTSAASSAATGASQVSSGASTLNDGLSAASGAVPSYSDEEAGELADSLAQPVSVSVHSDSGDSKGVPATRMGPHALSLSLWIGALVVVSGLGIMSRRRVEAAMTPVRLAITSLRPALVLAVVQAAALAGALALAGVRFGNMLVAVGLLLAGALAMTVLHAALMAALGARGASAISLLALAAQAMWVLTVGAPGGPSVPSGIAGVLPATVLDSALSGVMLGTADSSGRATSLAVLRREPAAA